MTETKEANPYSSAPETINTEEVPFLRNFGFAEVKALTAEFMGYEYWLRTRNPPYRLHRNRWERMYPIEPRFPMSLDSVVACRTEPSSKGS